MPATSYPKKLEECARAQLISQCVDTGQLNIPTLQQPITLSLTKVMLDWIPDKLAHNAPSQSELQEARQAIPEFNGGNTLDKREATDPRRRRREKCMNPEEQNRREC